MTGASVRAAIGIGLAIASTGLLVLVLTSHMMLGLDFASYSYGVTAWMAGGSPYHPALLAGPFQMAASSGHAFIYPPPALLLLVPFTTSTVGLVAWMVLGTSVLLSGLLAILRLHGQPISFGWIGAILLGLTLSGGLPQALAFGNASPLVGGLLAWAYVGRAGPAGAVAGLLKVTPGLMAALDGWRGAWSAAAISALVVLATLPLVGAHWPDFMTVMSHAEPDCGHFISVACAIAPIGGMGVAKGVTLGLALLLAGAAIFARSRMTRLGLVTLALYASATELALTSHYHVYAAPLLVALVSGSMDSPIKAGDPRGSARLDASSHRVGRAT